MPRDQMDERRARGLRHPYSLSLGLHRRATYSGLPLTKRPYLRRHMDTVVRGPNQILCHRNVISVRR